MFMRILHSTPARLVRALAGTWLFVEGSVAQGVAGIALMAAGTLLVVTAGADVCVLDAVWCRQMPPRRRRHDVSELHGVARGKAHDAWPRALAF